jgi:hypothetical protein
MRFAGGSGVRRIVVSLAVVGVWMVSCRDIPAPVDGVHAVGPLRLPSPGLVAGDTMRDSTGAVAAIDVVVYGIDGEPLVPQPAKTFILLDTLARLEGATLIGTSTGQLRIVGSVGAVQTRPDTVPVTLSPDTLVLAANDSLLHRVTYNIATDTVVNSPGLNVDARHLGATSTGVEAVVVKYAIVKAPAGTAPTLLLMNSNVISGRDTTDGQGRASRVARLRLAALSTFVSDTAAVSATASYRGRVLGTVTFTIVYTKQ